MAPRKLQDLAPNRRLPTNRKALVFSIFLIVAIGSLVTGIAFVIIKGFGQSSNPPKRSHAPASDSYFSSGDYLEAPREHLNEHLKEHSTEHPREHSTEHPREHSTEHPTRSQNETQTETQQEVLADTPTATQPKSQAGILVGAPPECHFDELQTKSQIKAQLNSPAQSSANPPSLAKTPNVSQSITELVATFEQFFNKLVDIVRANLASKHASGIKNFLESQHQFIKQLSSEENWQLLINMALNFASFPLNLVGSLLGYSIQKEPISDNILSIPVSWTETFDFQKISQFLEEEVKNKKEFEPYKALLAFYWVRLDEGKRQAFKKGGWHPFKENFALHSENPTTEEVKKMCKMLKEIEDQSVVAKEAFQNVNPAVLKQHASTLCSELKNYPNAAVYLHEQLKANSIPATENIKNVATIKDPQVANVLLSSIGEAQKEEIIKENFSSVVGQQLIHAVLSNPESNSKLFEEIPVDKIEIESNKSEESDPVANDCALYLSKLPWDNKKREMFKRLIRKNKNKPFLSAVAQLFVQSPGLVQNIAEEGRECYATVQNESQFREELFFNLANNAQSWKELKNLGQQFIRDFLSAIGFVNRDFVWEFADPYLSDSHIDRLGDLAHLVEMLQVQKIAATEFKDAKYSKLRNALSVPSESLKVAGKGRLGLSSSGKSNSCFFNSLLQPLLHTPELGFIFHKLQNELQASGDSVKIEQRLSVDSKDPQAHRYAVLKEFLALYDLYWNSTENKPVPKGAFYDAFDAYFKTANNGESILNDEQQDVQECLTQVIDCFDEFISNLASINPRFAKFFMQFRLLFYVQIHSTADLGCSSPDGTPHRLVTIDTHSIQNIGFPHSSTSGSLVTFNDILQSQSKSSFKYNCDLCNRHVSTTQVHQFKCIPKIFVVNFKRYFYDQQSGNFQKIEKPISFPNGFDFKINKESYQIYAFIKHMGSTSGGHYVSYWRDEKDLWHLFNDSAHEAISKEKAMMALEKSYVVFFKHL